MVAGQFAHSFSKPSAILPTLFGVCQSADLELCILNPYTRSSFSLVFESVRIMKTVEFMLSSDTCIGVCVSSTSMTVYIQTCIHVYVRCVVYTM